MKKLVLFFLLVTLLLVNGKDLVHATRSPIHPLSCKLTENSVIVKLVPGEASKPGQVNLTAKVFQKGLLVAFGTRNTDLVALPATGVPVSIPLSKRINALKAYKVTFELDSLNNGKSSREWIDKRVSESDSSSFFDRNFLPIPEPNSIRKSIEAIKVKSAMGLF